MRRTGHPGFAASTATTALAIAQRGGYPLGEGEALTVLAASHLDSDQLEPAADHAEQTIAINTETGRRLHQARAHLIAAAARDRLADPAAADKHRRQARAVFADAGVSSPETGYGAVPAGIVAQVQPVRDGGGIDPVAGSQLGGDV